MFSAGNLYGTVVFTFASYQTPTGLTLDSSGSIFVGSYNGLYRWIPSLMSLTHPVSGVYWGILSVRLDSYGNIYVGDYSMTPVQKISILTNTC